MDQDPEMETGELVYTAHFTRCWQDVVVISASRGRPLFTHRIVTHSVISRQKTSLLTEANRLRGSWRLKPQTREDSCRECV